MNEGHLMCDFVVIFFWYPPENEGIRPAIEKGPFQQDMHQFLTIDFSGDMVVLAFRGSTVNYLVYLESALKEWLAVISGFLV